MSKRESSFCGLLELSPAFFCNFPRKRLDLAIVPRTIRRIEEERAFGEAKGKVKEGEKTSMVLPQRANIKALIN